MALQTVELGKVRGQGAKLTVEYDQDPPLDQYHVYNCAGLEVSVEPILSRYTLTVYFDEFLSVRFEVENRGVTRFHIQRVVALDGEILFHDSVNVRLSKSLPPNPFDEASYYFWISLPKTFAIMHC